MKKLLIIVAAMLLSATTLVAKEDSKDIIMSGNVGISYHAANRIEGNKDGTSEFTLDIGPQILFGIYQKLYLGADIFAHLKYFNEYKDGNKIENGYKNMFGIAPTARFYGSKWKLFGFFFDVKIGFSMGVNNEKTLFSALYTGISPGMEFFMGKNWSVAASLNNLLSYTLENANPERGKSYQKSDFDFSLNPMEINYAPLKLTLSYHF